MFGITSPEDLEGRIRRILRAERAPDVSRAACKAWARAFISHHVPRWYPGKDLSTEDAQRVGRLFEELCGRVYGYVPPRMKSHVRNDHGGDDDDA